MNARQSRRRCALLLTGLGLCSRLAHAEPTAPSGAASTAPASVEVTVGGEQPLQRSSARAPTAASTVISGERLRRAGGSSAEVLQEVVGVDVQRSGSSASMATATIRGSDSYQTPVYLAGIRINDDISGAADLSTVPLWMVQRVEVFRGNAPFSVDRLGLSGAVIFEPKRPTRTRVGALAQLGSFGELEGWSMAEVGAPSASALVGLRSFRTQGDFGFWNDHGQRFIRNETYEPRINSNVRDLEAWSIGDTQLPGGGHLTFLLNALRREQGVPGIATTQAESSRAERQRLLTGISARLPCASGGKCTLSVESNLLQEQTAVHDPGMELWSLAARWVGATGLRTAQGLGVRVRVNEGWELGLHAGYQAASLGVDRLGYLASRAERHGAALSADSQLQLSQDWLLYAMVHAQCQVTNGASETARGWNDKTSNDCGTLPEARVGTALALTPELTALGNVSHTVRVPTLGELYGTGPTVAGNPELKREDGRNADVGLRGQWASGQSELAIDTFVFGRWSRELVRYRRTSLNAFSPYNVGRARILGVELAIASRWFEVLETRTALTGLDPKETTDSSIDTTPNDVLPYTSQLLFNQWIGVASPWKRFGLRNAGLGARYFYAASRFADVAGLGVLPARQSWSLEGDLHLQRPDIALRAAVDNLLDARLSDFIGLPLPGRAFHAALEAWW